MVEIVRIFWSIGIEEYDIIPEWGKETIPYIIENHGKQIVKKLEGPLKQIVQLWLNLAEAK